MIRFCVEIRKDADMSLVNRATLDLIKRFEGRYLKAYICPAGVLTIGYGHTGKDVKLNMTITEEDADRLLWNDIEIFATGVNVLVKVPLNENQFGALVSFSFNVGLGALEKSTLLRLLNNGLYDQVPAQLMRWNKGGGRELSGLTKRRAAEAELFMRPVSEAA